MQAWPLPSCEFVDITRASGIDFEHKSSATSNKYLLETMGGGVALLDYDNDGRLDVFLTNGAKIDDPMPEGKRPDKSDPAFWNRLYQQTSSGTFVDVTREGGTERQARQNQYGMGVAVGDYDNDGFEDLYVTNYGGNTLYQNNGDGTFKDVTERAGVSLPAVGARARDSSTTTTTESSISSSRGTWTGTFRRIDTAVRRRKATAPIATPIISSP